MAVRKKNGHWIVEIYLVGKKAQVTLHGVASKQRAKEIEVQIKMACRTRDYSTLDVECRDACIRMFENQNLTIPHDLRLNDLPKEELTLKDACRIFLTDPEVKDSKCRERHMYSLQNLMHKLGSDRPVKEIKVPDLKRYRKERQVEGRSPATINREMATLSGVFRVLQEHELVEINPVRMLRCLSTKSGERQVYLARDDVERIASHCPEWFRPVLWTGYYTGMRLGEIVGVTRKNVNFSKRMIRLGSGDPKERAWKRVPIHRELVPILSEAIRTTVERNATVERKVTVLGEDKIFLVRDRKGLRPPGKDSVENCWPRALDALKWPKPRPTFHDLRHTWRRNARKSGMHQWIIDEIKGQGTRKLSVQRRYDMFSDEELLEAIDLMTFDHGETDIIVAGEGGFWKNGDYAATEAKKKEKGHAAT